MPLTQLDQPVSRDRDVRVDALRGMLILLMICNHIPSPFSAVSSHALGMLAAADGFVLLAAINAGRALVKRQRRAEPHLWSWAWSCSLTLYVLHLTCLAFGLIWIADLNQPDLPISWIMTDVLADPVHMGLATLALLHRPSFMDILPIYIVGFALLPILAKVARRDWRWLFLVGAGLWTVGFFSPITSTLRALTHLPHLYGGSFNPCSWLGLFVAGVAVGWRLESDHWSLPRSVVWSATIIAVLCWVSGVMPGVLTPWMTYVAKESLGPIRLLALAATAIAILSHGCHLRSQWAARLTPCVLIGRASLPIYVLHIPLVLVGQTVIQLWSFGGLGTSSVFVVVLIVSLALAWIWPQVFGYAKGAMATMEHRPVAHPLTPSGRVALASR